MSVLFAAVIVVPVALVVATVSSVLWRERSTQHEARVAVLSGIILAGWAVINTVLAYRGSYQPATATSVPPVGIGLIAALIVIALGLLLSGTLRRLLTRQSSLIRLHVWRVEGIVFIVLMLLGQVPALWALPAGLGDIAVGITSLWVARDLDTPKGKRRAIIWNLLGMLDLIVAVSLGVMTNPGPGQVFHTTPPAVLLTEFPLTLVPTFLVPLAFTLHIISLWQLLRGNWRRQEQITK